MKKGYPFIVAGLVFIIAAAIGRLSILPIGIALVIIGMGSKRKELENLTSPHNA